MYRNTTTRDPRIAQIDDFLMSSAIVGLTLEDNIFPIFLSPDPSTKSS